MHSCFTVSPVCCLTVSLFRVSPPWSFRGLHICTRPHTSAPSPRLDLVPLRTPMALPSHHRRACPLLRTPAASHSCLHARPLTLSHTCRHLLGPLLSPSRMPTAALTLHAVAHARGLAALPLVGSPPSHTHIATHTRTVTPCPRSVTHIHGLAFRHLARHCRAHPRLCALATFHTRHLALLHTRAVAASQLRLSLSRTPVASCSPCLTCPRPRALAYPHCRAVVPSHTPTPSWPRGPTALTVLHAHSVAYLLRRLVSSSSSLCAFTPLPSRGVISHSLPRAPSHVCPRAHLLSPHCPAP